MSENDLPTRQMNREELERFADGLDFIHRRILELAGELLDEWGTLTDAERRERFRKTIAPAIIYPRPLSREAVAALRAYVDRLEDQESA